jgi:hypothetical protein
MAKKGKTGGEPSASRQADGSKRPWAKKNPRAFLENTVYREQRVLSFQRLQTFSCFSYLLQISIIQFYVLSLFFFHVF